MQNPFGNTALDIDRIFGQILISLHTCPKDYELKVTVTHPREKSKTSITLQRRLCEDSNAPLMELVKLHTFICDSYSEGCEFSITNQLI